MLSSRQRKEFLVEFCNVSRFKKTTNNRIKSGKNLSRLAFRICRKLIFPIFNWYHALRRSNYIFFNVRKIPSAHGCGFVSGEDTIKRHHDKTLERTHRIHHYKFHRHLVLLASSWTQQKGWEPNEQTAEEITEVHHVLSVLGTESWRWIGNESAYSVI